MTAHPRSGQSRIGSRLRRMVGLWLVMAIVSLWAAAAAAAADFHDTFQNLNGWEVHDHPRLKPGQAAKWTAKDGKLSNAAPVELTDETVQKLRTRFGSNVVTRRSFADGTFRFKIETSAHPTYGIVFRYVDEDNYCRFDLNTLDSELIVLKQGKLGKTGCPSTSSTFLQTGPCGWTS